MREGLKVVIPSLSEQGWLLVYESRLHAQRRYPEQAGVPLQTRFWETFGFDL